MAEWQARHLASYIAVVVDPRGWWASWQVTQPNVPPLSSVASAPGPARPLRAYPAWFFAVAVLVTLVEDVALVAELLRDSPGRSRRRVDDCSVRKVIRHRREVVAPGAVATLAADGAVGRLGADPLPPRTRVGDMAIQATGNPSPHTDQFALEVFGQEANRRRRATSDPSPGLPPYDNTRAAPCGIDPARHG